MHSYGIVASSVPTRCAGLRYAGIYITKIECWQTHEIHDLECRGKSEKVPKHSEHEVLSKGGRGWKSGKNIHISSYFVLSEVGKCVELCSRIWQGLSLNSPIHPVNICKVC